MDIEDYLYTHIVGLYMIDDDTNTVIVMIFTMKKENISFVKIIK